MSAVPTNISYLMTYVLEHSYTPGALADQAAGVAGTTFDTGNFYTELGLDWYAIGGSVLTRSFTGGDYTTNVAPTLTVANATGTGAGNQAALMTAVMGAHPTIPGHFAVVGVTTTRSGRGYKAIPAVTVTTGSSSPVTHCTVTVLTISTTNLQINDTTSPPTALGYSDGFLHPAGLTGQNPMEDIYGIWTSTLDKVAGVLRYAVALNQKYAFALSGTTIQLWWHDVTGAASLQLANVTFPAMAINDRFLVRFIVTSTSSTTSDITASFYNLTTNPLGLAGPPQATVTKVGDTHAGVQTVGQSGTGWMGNSATSITGIDLWNEAGLLSLSILTAAAGANYPAVDIFGSGTLWQSAPTPPILTFTGVSVTAVMTVLSDTHIRVNLTIGGTAGNLTVTDSASLTFITIPVTGTVPGTLTISDITPTNITFNSTGANGGSPNYACTVYASRHAWQNPGVGDSHSIYTQSALPTNTPITQFSRTLDPGAWFFAATWTDSGGITALSRQTQCIIPEPYTGIRMIAGGDSITRGSGAGDLDRYVVSVIVGNGGTGYTSDPNLVFSGGSMVKSPVVGGMYRVGGVIKYVWLIYHGICTDSANPPAIAISGGGGSGAVMTAQVGGGMPYGVACMLRGLYGFDYPEAIDNVGIDGTRVGNWLLNGRTAGGVTNTAYYNLDRLLAQAQGPSVTKWIWLRLGSNDSSTATHVSAADYQAQMYDIVSVCVGLGHNVYLDDAFFRSKISLTTDDQTISLLQDYIIALNAVAAFFPNNVARPSVSNFWMLLDHPEWLSTDGLHPKAIGYLIPGGCHVPDIARCLGLSTVISIGGSAAFNFKLLSLVFNNVAIPGVGDAAGLLPSSVTGDLWIGLHTADPAGAGQDNHEILTSSGYTTYQRVSVSRLAAMWSIYASGGTSASASNSANVTFPTVDGGTNIVTHFSVGTANTGAGLLMYSAPLDSTTTLTSGEVPLFAPGTLTVRLS